jgi:hypothetical protein
MTPKDKAIDLYFKFEKEFRIYKQNAFEYDGRKTKNAVLILIDEMLLSYPSNCPKKSYEMEQHIFWNNVKTQLELI